MLLAIFGGLSSALTDLKSDYLETLVCALDLGLRICLSRRAILILLLINSIQIIGLKNLGEQVFLKSHSRNLRLKPNQQNVNRKQTDSIRLTQENHSKERYLMTNV